MFLACKKCGEINKSLILNVCEDCDPELHRVWKKAVESSIDFETVTPEIQKAFELVQARKAEKS